MVQRQYKPMLDFNVTVVVVERHSGGVLVFGPALSDHRITPARSDLLDLAIAAAHLRQQDVAGIDSKFKPELMGPEHAPSDLAALREAPHRLEFSRGVVPGVTLRRGVHAARIVAPTSDVGARLLGERESSARSAQWSHRLLVFRPPKNAYARALAAATT